MGLQRFDEHPNSVPSASKIPPTTSICHNSIGKPRSHRLNFSLRRLPGPRINQPEMQPSDANKTADDANDQLTPTTTDSHTSTTTNEPSGILEGLSDGQWKSFGSWGSQNVFEWRDT